MATNYFKEAYDKVIDLLTASSDFSYLKDQNRIFLRDVLMPKDFGPEDGIMIRPVSDELIEMRVPGREDQFNIDLVYFRKQSPEIDYGALTQVAENLIELFRDNQYRSSIEQLNETDFATHAKWDVTGVGDDSGGNCAFVFAGGTLNGTLTQTAVNRAQIARNSKSYRLTYTISVTTAPDGDFALTLDTFPASSQTLTFTAGTFSIEFTSASDASLADFVITAAETTSTQGSITIDDIILRELISEWHFIAPETVEYVIDLPEGMEEKNYYGFTMRVVILKGKYD